ncbi:dullard family phosphatase domain-containing protein [Cystoisospora suis]|uniref:Dullard family phosphatase domain-containing protein n=1 Tax=Cystoisospora suis TaxID=483139 RepID=A0A2C6LEI9_9APIC|nr:dullard family phosphatase domain-containing protein [Cystoisospora suis]
MRMTKAALCFFGFLSLFSSRLGSSSCCSSVSAFSQFSLPVSLFAPPLMLLPLSSCLLLSSSEGSSALQAPHVLVGFVLLAVFLIRFPVHRVVAKTLSSLLHPPARHYIRAHLAVPEGGVAGHGSGRNIQLHPRKLGCSQVRRSLVSFLGGSFRRGDGEAEHAERHSHKKGSLLRTGAGTRRGDSRRRRQQLPLTLVVDLDETLVLATRSRLSADQVTVDVSIQGKLSTFHVAQRPFADVFLAELFPLFQIVIFTAGRHEYANAILDTFQLHPYVDRCLTREDCHLVGPNLYAKDLGKVCSDLSKTVLIDDSPVAALYFPDNYIPIEGWCGNRADTALVDLLPLLLALCSVRDVRAVLQLRRRSSPPLQRCTASSPSADLSTDSVGSLTYHPALVCSSLPFSPPLQQPPALSAAVLAACRATMRAGLSGVCNPLHQVQVSIHQRVRCLAQGVCRGGANANRGKCGEICAGQGDTEENGETGENRAEPAS